MLLSLPDSNPNLGHNHLFMTWVIQGKLIQSQASRVGLINPMASLYFLPQWLVQEPWFPHSVDKRLDQEHMIHFANETEGDDFWGGAVMI